MMNLLLIPDPVEKDLALIPAPARTPLPVSPWRSLGGYLNYATWPGRERFLELDKAILIANRTLSGLPLKVGRLSELMDESFCRSGRRGSLEDRASNPAAARGSV